MRDATGEFECRHAAPKRVCLARGETGANNGDLHRLFLEQRHAERLFQHLTQFRCGILDRIQPLAPAQIRDAPCRPGSGRAARSPPGSRCRRTSSASAAATSTSARGIRSGTFPVCRPSGSSHTSPDLRRESLPDRCLSPCAHQQIERAAHAAQHAQAEHIDFHEAQGVDVVLVPLDHLTIVIAAGSIGTRSSNRSWVRTKPPGCCDICLGNRSASGRDPWSGAAGDPGR